MSDAARMLALGPARVRQLVDDGQLPCCRMTHGWRAFRAADVAALVKSAAPKA